MGRFGGYIFHGAIGLCFFLATLAGRSTFYFHARNRLAACCTQSGTEGIPCGSRYLSTLRFCRLRNPGSRVARMVKNQSWAGEAQHKRKALTCWRQECNGKENRECIFGEGRVFFLAVPI